VVPLVALLCALGCAGELTRGEQPVIIGRPVPRGDALAEAGPGDARPSSTPDAADLGRDAAPDADRPAAPTPPPPVYLRIVSEDPATGLRARLDPPQRPADAPDEALAILDAPHLVAVFEYGRPDDIAEMRARARLATGAATTMLLAPARSPDTVALDVRHIAAWILDSPSVARLDGRPLLFVEAAADAPDLETTLQSLAALPNPPAVALSAALAEPTAAERPGVAAELVVARYTSPAEGYADDGTGQLPDRTTRAAQARRRAALQLEGPVLPVVRAARNSRLRVPDAPAEAPGDDASLARSLVLARRLAREGLVVEAIGAFGDDRQLDRVDGEAATDRPESVTAGFTYAPYRERRLSLVRRALLASATAPPTRLGDETPPVVLDQSDAVTVRALNRTLEPGSGDPGWHLDLEDRTATGRLEVLLELAPFVVPAGASLVYRRDHAAVRLEFGLAGDEPDARPDALRSLMRDAPAEGVVTVPLTPLAGRVVNEVLLVYEGGAARVSAHVLNARIERAPIPAADAAR
jgi:hypothetical protein